MKAPIAAALVAGLFAAPALAQTTTASAPISSIGQTDVAPFVPNGVGGVPTHYNYVGTVAGQSTYQYMIPLTAFTITPANTTTLLFLNPAGTLATGTLTMPAAPNDGENFCLYDTQTQTAITVSASAGQTIAGTAVTALTANTRYCWVYINTTATWYRTQ